MIPRISRLSVVILLCIPSAPTGDLHASPPPWDGVRFRGPEPGPQRPPHYDPAAKRAAGLNVGEPRTVRTIYFLPRDRQPQPDIDETFDTLIREVQESYAEQMENHGFGRRTFRFETDADGRALVHHVKGKFGDVHYRTHIFNTVWDEVVERFDPRKNIYLVSLDVSESPECGRAGSWGPEGGMAVIPYANFKKEHAWDCGNVAVIAHELGHTFGVAHDYFRNAVRSPSSYHTDWMVTSFAAAEWLAAHRYFNDGKRYPERDEPTAIQMHRPAPVRPNAVRLRFEVSDSDGLHQTQLHNSTGEAVDFHGVNGNRATVEFVTTELTEAPGNEVELRVVDVYGNVSSARRLVNILSLLAPENVSIPDGNLAAAVRNTLEMAPGETVTQLEMLRLRKLRASSREIKHLTGLEYAPNLTDLALGGNEIHDITPLAGLIILEGLGLWNNDISDIQPLMQMNNLQRLWLSGNSVSDLSPLAGLTNLKVISLSRNPIGSTTPLHGLLRRNPFLELDIDSHSLEIVTGDGQKGAPGAMLAYPLVVEVRDPRGDPLSGARVTFKVTAGAGKLSGRFKVQHTTTDAGGKAELNLTLGPDPGPNTVVVSLDERDMATFQAQAVGDAVAELDGDYRTWHLPTGATVRLGKGAVGESDRAVALSPDGRCLAVAGGIGVWLYEAYTSRALALLPTGSRVQSVAFSLVGTLASGLDNGIVELWHVETGASLGTLRHSGWRGVTAVAFSSDGTRLASGSWDQVIKLWDVEGRREAGAWEVPRESGARWPLSVAFSPDGRKLASGFQDGTVRLWDVATRTEVATLAGHADRVTSVSYSPDGSLLASAGAWKDPTVRLWNTQTRTEVARLTGHTGGVRSVVFSPIHGDTLVSGSEDGTVRLWELAKYEEVATLTGHEERIITVEFSPDGATLVSAATDGTVLLRDLETGNVAGLSGHTSLSSMALSGNGVSLALGYQDGTVRLWDAATMSLIAALQGHSSWVPSISFSSDGATLGSGSWDRTVRLWDVKTREPVGLLEGHGGGVYSVAFSPDDATLASGSWDHTVRLWDVRTREQIGILEGHNGDVRSVAFSSDGALLASGGGNDDRTVRLWSVATRALIGTLAGHTSAVTAVAISPDNSLLASGSWDRTIRLWDVKTRERTATLENGHSVHSMAFSADGAMLASGSSGRTDLWDVETREQIASLEGHTRPVHSVAFSDGGNVLVTGSSDGTTLLWDLAKTLSPRIPDPDFDGDGTVGFADFLQFASRFGLGRGDAGYDARFDLDGNGAIGFSDFLVFASNFGRGV